MFQIVMILLVTAVVTIITTIVTVRVTMTGRVLSQDTSAKLASRANKYGVYVLMYVLIVLGFSRVYLLPYQQREVAGAFNAQRGLSYRAMDIS